MSSDRICEYAEHGLCNKYYAKGLCRLHYMRRLKGRDMLAKPIVRREGCEHPECDRKHYGHGFCHTHWMQKKEWQTTWDIGSTRRGYTWRVRDESGRPTLVQPCVMRGCEENSRRNKMCARHSQQRSQGVIPRLPSDPACPILDCPAIRKRYGVCHKHKSASVRFGLSVQELIDLFGDSGGRCSACRSEVSISPEKERKLEPHIDHDHSCCPSAKEGNLCGKCVRGILCRACNLALGSARDSVEVLEALIEYLRSNREL